MINDIMVELLRTYLHYDPETGIFTWIKAKGAQKAGHLAGALKPGDGGGYIVIRLDSRLYQAHRLAWLYMTGCWPVGEIDHWDTNRSNNRWDNLRDATSTQNKGNMRLPSHNTSGIKGVSWHKGTGKWAAGIKVNRQKKHLGLFESKEAAREAYAVAAKTHFGEFARF